MILQYRKFSPFQRGKKKTCSVALTALLTLGLVGLFVKKAMQHLLPVSPGDALLLKQIKSGEIIYKSNSKKNEFFTRYGLSRDLPYRFAPPPLSDPWPLPRIFHGTFDLYEIDPQTLLFEIEKIGAFLLKTPEHIQAACPTLINIIDRYQAGLLYLSARSVPIRDAILHPGFTYMGKASSTFSNSYRLNESHPTAWRRMDEKIKIVSIEVMGKCSGYPFPDSDESYTLKVGQDGIKINANDIWGVLYAFETLSQLIHTVESKLEHESSKKPQVQQYVVRGVAIKDWPRFQHRGVLIDSARHFLPKSIIKRNIDAMLQNKFNVLHWHLTDDNSFPLELASFPEFAKKAAFSPKEIYTAKDVDEIVEYARQRGVRIMPEIDTPGHVFAWRHLPMDIMTRCYDKQGQLNGDLGPLDPTKEETFKALEIIFKDVSRLFQNSHLIHAGGDEVPMSCWLSNPNILRTYVDSKIRQFGNKSKVVVTEYTLRELVTAYNKRLIDIITKAQSAALGGEQPRIVMWEEAYKNDQNLPKTVAVHVWLGSQETVRQIATAGYSVIFSSCWYLDQITETGIDWINYYLCDPVHLRGQVLATDERKILGGEAALWGEYVDENNIFPLLWPRASAVAERLWTSSRNVDVDYAARRLEEHRCRMIRRGIPTSPVSGPNTCQTDNLFFAASDIAAGLVDRQSPKTNGDDDQLNSEKNNSLQMKIYKRTRQRNRDRNNADDCLVLIIVAVSNNFHQLCIGTTSILATTAVFAAAIFSYFVIRQKFHQRFWQKLLVAKERLAAQHWPKYSCS